jgi:hypothetical protein
MLERMGLHEGARRLGAQRLRAERVEGPDRLRSERVERLRAELRELAGDFDPALVDARSAKELLEAFAEIERLGAAVKTLCARRVAETQVWADAGDRSAAHWLARTTGSTVRDAVSTIETARRLERLPETEDALRAGGLSAVQAMHVASAATADRGAERRLLEAAGQESVQGLREECRRVQAAASAREEADRYEAIRRERYLHHWTEPHGAFRLDAVLTPDAGATVLAALAPHRDRLEREARAAGRYEPPDALAADALVALAESRLDAGRGRKAAIEVRVDHAAFVRGHAERGEVCEIPGVGPIPVATARTLAADAVVTAVVTDGVDVTTIARVDRTIPVALRQALEARDPVCVAAGCAVRDRLEIDHVVPFADGGPTALDNLARLCRWHHHLKTHRGFRLERAGARWHWLPPPDPG